MRGTVCGTEYTSPVDEVTVKLEARGLSLAQIHRECFFNASY